MPRARKNQPATAYPGAQYGEGVDAIQSQKVVPLPDNRSGGVAPPAAPPGAYPVPGHADAATLAQQMTPPAALVGSGGPMTGGLSTGPGPGPAQLRGAQATGSARLLQQMAEITGDPFFTSLAERTRLQ